MRQCTTHHLACDCREARAAGMEAALRKILAIQGQVMPGWNDELIKATLVRKIAEKGLEPGQGAV
jgi:hypothetical protein